MIREAEVGVEKLGEQGCSDAEEDGREHDGSKDCRKESEECLDLNQRKRRRARSNESAQYET